MLLRWLFVSAALAGSLYSAIWARADYLFRQNTKESVAAAVRLVPYNSTYLVWLAYLEPERKAELLKRAVELNLFDSQSLVELGLWAELREKDPQRAISYYRQAAAVDKTYLPKWTLTNYFYRQGNASEFFRWAKATLAITPDSPAPVFDEMWSATDDGRLIENAIPDRLGILLSYVSYLNRQDYSTAIPAVVDRIVALEGNKPVGRDDIIGPAEDNLLANNQLTEALHVWSTLSKAGWINFAAPTPTNPLTNGGFQGKPFGHGFDWISSFPKTTHIAARQLQLKFEGCPNSVDSCLLLAQYLPLDPGHDYRLEWSAESEAFSTPSGLVWKTNWQTGAARDPDLLDQNNHAWDFQVPPDRNLGSLQLWYSRPPGTVFHPGTFTLRNVSLREH